MPSSLLGSPIRPGNLLIYLIGDCGESSRMFLWSLP